MEMVKADDVYDEQEETNGGCKESKHIYKGT
jgi:hypothetical protein